ncbi:protease, partial [Salmonella enterica]|nr:protease [Salmonella enterica]
CKHIVLPELPAAWRPAPDGIDLLNHDGMSILFFSQDGESYRSNIWDKQGKILKRNIK